MKLVVLVLARNCAAYVPTLFRLIDEISKKSTVIAIVGENGSTDETRALLEHGIAAGLPFSVIDTAPMSSVPDRYQRMALGRQMLLESAKEASPDADFVCVMDADDTLALAPTADKILEAAGLLAASNELFAVAATSAPTYYDLLALRAPGMFDTNILEDKKEHENNPLRYYNYFKTKIYDTHDRITAHGNFLATSAFNGLCIYRAAAYYPASYLGGRDGICEHVTLNVEIHRHTGHQILVSDLLVVNAPSEHIRQSAFEFTRRRARKALAAMRGRMSLRVRE